MGIIVNTNIMSMDVQRNLASATNSIRQSVERLSTGSKINNAGDDAAGLSISQNLQAQTRGTSVASTNAQTGVNLLQTAEGDLGVIQSNLQRIRDLTVQAANGTYGTSERNAILSEVQQRINEISRTAQSSSFNSIKLLNGSSTTLTLQIGANFDPTAVSLNTLVIGSPLKSATATSLGIGSVSSYFANSIKAASFINLVDSAIATISADRSTIGSLQNRLSSAITSLTVRNENLTAAGSQITDTDIAQESANLTRSQILQQASASLLTQANSSPKIALNLLQGA